MDNKNYAIIVAGGSGARMGGDVAKQFMELGGKPVIATTVERFLSLSFPLNIILVLPSEYKEYWKNYCFESRLNFRHTLVSGGLTRFHSVKNALKHVKRGGVVAVHDGVRPFVTVEFIERLFSVARKSGAVIPVINPYDSIRMIGGNGDYHVADRSKILLVQTPQVFHSDILLDAYTQPYSPAFTDDASVVESTGIKIDHTEGMTTNIKLTKPADMLLAKAILSVF